MGILARAVSGQTKGANTVYDRWLELMNAGSMSKAGQAVTLQKAMRVGTAFACMSKIATGVAQVPFKLFRETQAGGQKRIEPATDHPLYDLMTSKPNAWSTSYDFRETLAMHGCMGNAYAFKVKRRGILAELIILDPGLVRPVQNEDWSIVFEVRGRDGKKRTVSSDDIWHIRGRSWDGTVGLDLLSIARDALGLSMAAEETHAKLHANGVQATGVYSLDATLNADQYEALTRWIKKQVSGDNAGAPLILDRGAKWVSQQMSSIDAQHLEMRQFQIEEVCRFFDVLPVMVGHSDKASTYASAEQMFLAHVKYTLSPWYARIEQSADANLLTEAERRDGYYFRFIAAGLERGSLKDRGDYYAKALGAGGSPAWMTQDEVRALEEHNPMGGEASELPRRLNDAAAPAGDGGPTQ